MAKRIVKVKRSASAEEVMLDEAFDSFIIEKEAANCSKSTINNYKFSYKQFTEFHGFNRFTTTEEANLKSVQVWIAAMLDDDMSIVTINHYLRDLRAFLYWCMDESRQFIVPNYKIKMVAGQEEQLKFYTDDELSLLLEKPARNAGFVEWRMWAIVAWVLGTANRASTICEVKIGDVDFETREIKLRHTKNKKAQTIPLSTALENTIKEYMRMWRGYVNEDAWMFPNVGEEQLTVNALHKAFVRYCNDRGVYKTNLHGLRHSFARGWVRNGGNLFVLQRILGHSTLDMTKRYVALFAEDLKEGYDDYAPLDTIRKQKKRRNVVRRSIQCLESIKITS